MRRFLLLLLAAAATAGAATYSTYIGDTYPYEISAMATDANGNTYVTGGRRIQSPAVGSPITDVFVGKLDPSGDLSLIATFSGKGSDFGTGIAVDASGNIYISGYTSSLDFPLRNPIQVTSSGNSGFVMKLAPDGSILYSTYLGGTKGDSSLTAVAADADGNAYVTGTTGASDYPHTSGLPVDPVAQDNALGGTYGAFFAKLGPTGSLVFAGALTAPVLACNDEPGSNCNFEATYAGGTAIALDPAGNAYIAGNATGTGLATTPGALLANGLGAFVAKVNAAGTAMVYVTSLGPGVVPGPGVGTEVADTVTAIAADSAGNAYLSGQTMDPAFPATSGSFQGAAPYAWQAFVAKLNPAGSAIVWANLLGPSEAQQIALDPSGHVWTSGTAGAGFLATVTVTPNGGEFVAELDATGSNLLYSATFPVNTVAQALAVDISGAVHAAGSTGVVSAFAPSSAPGVTTFPWLFGLTNAAGGTLSGRLAAAELISIYGINIGPITPVYGTFSTARFLPATLGGIQVTVNGIAAPLLYVSATQINAVAPVELTPAASVTLQVTVGSTTLPEFRLMVDPADPAVFLSSAGAAAVNQDGTLNSPTSPAPAGSYVSIWATGTGYALSADGQQLTAANQYCDGILLLCPVYSIDGTLLTTAYSGAAPDMVTGAIQINFQVNSNSQYYISAGGTDSPVFTLYTQ